MNITQLLSLPELRTELERVDDALIRSVSSENPFLTEVAAHLISAGGKRLRPTLAIATALTASEGPVDELVIKGGAAVEMVHLGSLYHDDVLDEATMRRKVASVNARWDNFMAIIAGDYLLARASALAAELGIEATKVLADTIAQLCEGQVREHQYAYRLDRSIDAYEASIDGKTASLIASSARIGGIAAGLPREQVEALTTFAHGFGMAFQIRDDILDIVGTDAQLGKPAGNDLMEGVYTLPVIFALQEDTAGRKLRELLGGPIDVAERDAALGVIRSSGGVDAATKAAKRWAQHSLDALSAVRASSMTDHLSAMATTLLDDLD